VLYTALLKQNLISQGALQTKFKEEYLEIKELEEDCRAVMRSCSRAVRKIRRAATGNQRPEEEVRRSIYGRQG
jgi:hypothetical protein